MRFRFLGIDLDGTLLNARKRVPPDALAVLNAFYELNPNLVGAIVTGRQRSTAEAFCRQVNAAGPFKIKYLACANGAQLWAVSPAGELSGVYQKPLAPAAAKTVWDECVRRRFVFLGYPQNPPGPKFNAVVNPGIRGKIVAAPRRRVRALAVRDCPNEGFWKVNVLGASGRRLAELSAWLRANHPGAYTVCHTARMMLEITAFGTGKDAAVEAICAREGGIPAPERVALGDSANDAPMFAVCGESVAMARAPRALKMAATHACAGGFAQAFENYLLPLARRAGRRAG